ncbi:MAG: hypothetical protein ACREFE_14455 [Limisphaerales bacterium]
MPATNFGHKKRQKIRQLKKKRLNREMARASLEKFQKKICSRHLMPKKSPLTKINP